MVDYVVAQVYAVPRPQLLLELVEHVRGLGVSFVLEDQLDLVEEGGELGLSELAGEEGLADLAVSEVEGGNVQGLLVCFGKHHYVWNIIFLWKTKK